MSWDQTNVDADVKELQHRLATVRRQLRRERAERERLTSRLAKLQRRRSVRVALAMGAATRPALQLARQLRKRWRTRRWRPAGTLAKGAEYAPDAVNPFFAQVPSLGGSRALDGVEPGRADTAGAALELRSLGDGPLVSVIMVVSDAAVPVEPCLQSILLQSYPRWELLVRDCTDHGDWKSPLAAADPRVSVGSLRSTNEGVARNHGLAAARGEMFAYLDPPGLWHPQFLETLVAALVGDRARFVAFGNHTHASPEQGRQEPKGGAGGDADYAELVRRRELALSAVVHRRELYDEVGEPSTTSHLGHDRDLLLKYTFLREPLRVDSVLLWQPSVDASDVRGTERQSAAALRASTETYFRERCSVDAGMQRPALTIVGGTGELAHERAWDLAAVAGEVTSTQLVDLRFRGKSAYAPRLLPAPETEMMRLDGDCFPRWAPTLARAVANVHGEVVYAAEPRLSSLGLALLASFHHGVPVIADLSHPRPLASGADGTHTGTERSLAEPVNLRDVDPADERLLDPHSLLWDRIMAGIVQEVPFHVVGSHAQRAETASNPFIVYHPKAETAFDPSAHDRGLARRRLGLGPNERVLLCGGHAAAVWSAGQRLDLLDALAARCRLLVLGGDSTSAPAETHQLNRASMVIGRADEDNVAAGMAASDALLLWREPRSSPTAHDGLPPELGSALALNLPVIANDFGELGALGRSGYLLLVPFGDVDSLMPHLDASAYEYLRTKRQVAAGKRLFMREFSHAAARVHMGMVLHMVKREGGALGVAEDFAKFFAECYRHWRPNGSR